ncbi:hypothetical protein [Deinococcus sp. PEB2-63]
MRIFGRDVMDVQGAAGRWLTLVGLLGLAVTSVVEVLAQAAAGEWWLTLRPLLTAALLGLGVTFVWRMETHLLRPSPWTPLAVAGAAAGFLAVTAELLLLNVPSLTLLTLHLLGLAGAAGLLTLQRR